MEPHIVGVGPPSSQGEAPPVSPIHRFRLGQRSAGELPRGGVCRHPLAGRTTFGYTPRHGGQDTEVRHVQVL